MNEGWSMSTVRGQPKKYHYFRNGTSLCVRDDKRAIDFGKPWALTLNARLAKNVLLEKQCRKCTAILAKETGSTAYTMADFKIAQGTARTGDKRIPFMFTSKDGKVQANFFWEPDNVEVRGIIFNGSIVNIAYPFANRHGCGTLPKPSAILTSIIRRLREMDVTKQVKKREEKLQRARA